MITERDTMLKYARKEERRWKVGRYVRVEYGALKVRQRVQSAKARKKDSQSTEAIGRMQYIREGHAR